MSDISGIIQCVNFAAVQHKDQRRKDPEKTPYINHPIGVAQLLIEAGVSDCDVIKAALLHDTIEDTNTTQQQLIDTFGPRVAGIVAEVV
ncbi:hypothetical protein Pmani_002069 [Petrolisthes manimaculis]|uniref:Uncharacterized protein n=1 Tax=Petrolisthes manimaculis TaxID=1843537 RepID=A0AAE1QKY7_9EUCA|nr:hypothetical protein Pmani_002069 [Petrolisthes manimaculis]